MTREEYEDWREAERAQRRAVGIRAFRPCADCTLAFQQENLLAGTCNGAIREARDEAQHPPIRLRQWREASARKRAGIRIRRSAAEVRALAVAARALREAGLSYSAIGERFGIDHSYARDLCLPRGNPVAHTVIGGTLPPAADGRAALGTDHPGARPSSLAHEGHWSEEVAQ
jgi:hypothetical protein